MMDGGVNNVQRHLSSGIDRKKVQSFNRRVLSSADVVIAVSSSLDLFYVSQSQIRFSFFFYISNWDYFL